MMSNSDSLRRTLSLLIDRLLEKPFLSTHFKLLSIQTRIRTDWKKLEMLSDGRNSQATNYKLITTLRTFLNDSPHSSERHQPKVISYTLSISTNQIAMFDDTVLIHTQRVQRKKKKNRSVSGSIVAILNSTQRERTIPYEIKCLV